jgi:hypothetical protein
MRIARPLGLGLLVALALPAPARAATITDTFSTNPPAAGADINGRAFADGSGASWVRDTSTSGTFVGDGTGGIYSAFTGSVAASYHVTGWTPASADYSVTATINFGSATNETPIVLARVQTNTAKWVGARYNEVQGGWQIIETDASSFPFTNVTTARPTGSHTVTITVTGSNAFLYLDGSGTATVTRALTLSGAYLAGSPGLFNSQGGAAATTGQHITAFSATSTAATPSSAAAPSSIATGANRTVTITGTNTAWTGATTFSISNAGTTSGASIVSQSIAGQVATLTVNPGSAAGTLTITDGSLQQTLTVAAAGVATSFTLTAPGARTGSTLASGGATLVPSLPFVLKANGTTTAAVALSDGGAGGTFSPASPFLNGTTNVNFAYQPRAGSPASVTISATSAGLTAPASVTYTVVPNLAILCGDSQTDENYNAALGANAYPATLRANLGPTWDVFVLATSGDTIVFNAAAAAASGNSLGNETNHVLNPVGPNNTPLVDTYTPDPARTSTIVVQWCGTNDLNYSDTGVNVHNNNRAFLVGRKAVGGYVRAINVLPLPRAAFNAAQETQRQSFISLTLANGKNYADATVRLDLDRRLANAGDTTYFRDGTHLTASGAPIVAGQVLGAIGEATVAAPAVVGRARRPLTSRRAPAAPGPAQRKAG